MPGRLRGLPLLSILALCLAAAVDTSATERALQRALAEAKPGTSTAAANVESLWARFTEASLRWGKQHWGAPCPKWVAEYTLAAARYDKSIVHLCNTKEGAHCDGPGDRIRAIEDLTRTARLCKRSLAIKWEPVGLEQFFEPASALDWRPSPAVNTSRWAMHEAPLASLQEGAACAQEHPRLWTNTNQGEITRPNTTNAQGEVVAAPLGGRQSVARSCIFNTLFKPTQVLADAVRKKRTELFGSPDAPYIAINLAFGALMNSNAFKQAGMELRRLAVVLQCAFQVAMAALAGGMGQVAHHANITAPVLLMTDHHALRMLVGNDRLTGVVGPRTHSRHVSTPTPHGQGGAVGGKGGPGGADPGPGPQDLRHRYAPTYTDLGLLAQAKCVLLTESGLGDTAVEWGRHDCVISVNACQDVVKEEHKLLEQDN